MTARCRRVVLGSGLGLYPAGAGLRHGHAVERIRFDRQRTTVVHQYEERARRLEDFWMTIERTSEATR